MGIIAEALRGMLASDMAREDVIAAVEMMEATDTRRRREKSRQQDSRAYAHAAKEGFSPCNPLSQENNKTSYPPSSPQRGHRLPTDWQLPDAWRGDATRIGIPGLKIDWEAEKFRDHFVAKPGGGGRKLDWRGTFRNWCKKAMEMTYRHYGAQHHGQPSLREVVERISAAADQCDDAGGGSGTAPAFRLISGGKTE